MTKKKKGKGSKKNDKGYIKYLIILTVIILILSSIYVFFNLRDDDTNLTIKEKKWITDHKDTLIDISVPNNISIISNNGSGIVFDYLKKVEKDTGLKFNKISYNYGESVNLSPLSIATVNYGTSLKEKDIKIAEDNYVLVGIKDEKLDNIKNISSYKIGVLTNDLKMLKNTLGANISFKEYKDENLLVNSLKTGNSNYVIAPRGLILDKIALNKYSINYNFDDISNKIVLRATSRKTLNSIMTKYLENFKINNYFKSLEKSFKRFYETTSGQSDMSINSLSDKVYKYGYVKGSNYNIEQNNTLTGYAGEYINMLSNMASMDIKSVSYRNSESLAKDIENGSIDIAFIDFDYDNTNGLYTTNGFNTSLVALSKNSYLINKKEGLIGRNLYTLEKSPIKSYLSDNFNANTTPISSVNKKIPFDGILVLDEVDYYAYNPSYYVVCKDTYKANYSYFVKQNEKALYDYINFILMYSDGNDIKENSINKITNNKMNENSFISTYLLIVLIILVPIIVIFLLLIVINTKRHTTLLRKESVLKYTDMLTSLKNREYLRANMNLWDEAKIIPRAVIVIDLNNLSYVNDHYGIEEGNLLIKKAAAILMNTQLEKSEIMRTDGNEFLLYLIGYTETQVTTYVNKLSKEFEKLPYNFGAGIGYSMIEDKIKTIDDAINEASNAMRQDKEQNYK